MSPRIATACALFATACLASACAYQLPPRLAPTESVPRVPVEPGPEPANHGRVTLDAEGGPVDVVEIVSATTAEAHAGTTVGYAAGETTKPICRTPCVVDLSYGSHRMRFGDDPRAYDVKVGARPSVVRVALGHHHDGGWVQSLAIVPTIVGCTFAGVGGVTHFREPDDKTALSFLIGGGITCVVGTIIVLATNGTSREGALKQWTPADGVTFTF